MELAEVLLRGESTLGRGERGVSAAAVSRLNGCDFCFNAHGTHAALQLDGGWDTVDAAMVGADAPPITAKLRSLLAIAEAVRNSGRSVTPKLVQDAKASGATDLEIHDTVLIAAAFSMFNRYVDGLAAWAPANRDDYLAPGRRIVDRGYLA